MTPLKLTRAYADYYCGWYGLDPEIASLIAGRPIQGRESGCHYYSTDYRVLAESYRQTFHRFHRDIIVNCRAAGQRLLVPPKERQENYCLLGPVGSFTAPELEDVRQWLRALRERLQAATSKTERRNLYASYVYEALRIATGMRAQNSPPFRPASIFHDAENWWIRVSDKDAGGKERKRVVPLAPRVAAMVEELHQHNMAGWKPVLGTDLERGDLRWPDVLFMSTKDRKAYPLSFPQMRRTCERIGLRFPGWKANAYRHLLSAWLHDHCGYRETDYMLGHAHRGPAADDPLGNTPATQHALRILPAAEALLDELDVRPIRI